MNATDLVVGSRGYGAVTTGVDAYAFSGRITAFDAVEGPLAVVVNGREVDDPIGEP